MEKMRLLVVSVLVTAWATTERLAADPNPPSFYETETICKANCDPQPCTRLDKIAARNLLLLQRRRRNEIMMCGKYPRLRADDKYAVQNETQTFFIEKDCNHECLKCIETTLDSEQKQSIADKITTNVSVVEDLDLYHCQGVLAWQWVAVGAGLIVFELALIAVTLLPSPCIDRFAYTPPKPTADQSNEQDVEQGTEKEIAEVAEEGIEQETTTDLGAPTAKAAAKHKSPDEKHVHF